MHEVSQEMHWVAEGSLLIIYIIPDNFNKINWNLQAVKSMNEGFVQSTWTKMDQ
jgi:hypothetical protein